MGRVRRASVCSTMRARISIASPNRLHYARLFQGELMSAGRGRSAHLTRVVERYIRPISVRLMAVLQEGIASGEFRPRGCHAIRALDRGDDCSLFCRSAGGAQALHRRTPSRRKPCSNGARPFSTSSRRPCSPTNPRE